MKPASPVSWVSSLPEENGCISVTAGESRTSLRSGAVWGEFQWSAVNAETDEEAHPENCSVNNWVIKRFAGKEKKEECV